MEKQKAWAELLLKRPRESSSEDNVDEMSNWIQDVLDVSDLSGLGLDESSSASIMKLINVPSPVDHARPYPVEASSKTKNGEKKKQKKSESKPEGKVSSTTKHCDTKNVDKTEPKPEGKASETERREIKKSSGSNAVNLNNTGKGAAMAAYKAKKRANSPIKQKLLSKSMKKGKRKGRVLPPKKLIMQTASNDENETTDDNETVDDDDMQMNTDVKNEFTSTKEVPSYNDVIKKVKLTSRSSIGTTSKLQGNREELLDDATTSSEDSVDLRVQKRQKR